MGRTIKIEVLTFDELNDKQKEQAIELYRKKNYENLFDDEDARNLADYLEEKLTEFGYPNDIKVYFSLSYSQGDGVSFDMGSQFSQDEIMKVAEKLMEEEDFKALKKFTEEDSEVYGTIKHSGRYYHKYSFNVEFETNVSDDIDEESEEKFLELVEKLNVIIVDNLREFSSEFENIGYKTIEEHYSDDYIKDTIINNDREFELSADGTVCKMW
jgi:hypothetical protein